MRASPYSVGFYREGILPVKEVGVTAVRSAAVEEAVLAVVRDELEAELLCQLLREHGVQCGHRKTNFAAGAFGALPTGGWREVIVSADDVDAARELLPPPERAPS